MSFLGDAIDSATSFLGGSGDSSTSTTTTGVHKMGKSEKKIYNKFMQQFQDLYGNMQGLQKTKEGAYDTLSSALKGYGGQYQNTIQGLMDSITSGNNDLSFSLGGGNSASFTPNSVRSNASTVSNLAEGLYKNQMTEPLSTYNFLSENNDYATNLDYYNILQGLAQTIQNRRYGVTNSTTTKADTSTAGLNDVLSALQDTTGGVTSLAALFA